MLKFEIEYHAIRDGFSLVADSWVLLQPPAKTLPNQGLSTSGPAERQNRKDSVTVSRRSSEAPAKPESAPTSSQRPPAVGFSGFQARQAQGPRCHAMVCYRVSG